MHNRMEPKSSMLVCSFELGKLLVSFMNESMFLNRLVELIIHKDTCCHLPAQQCNLENATVKF